MGEFQDGQDVTYKAGADLRTHQYKALRLSDDNTVDVASGTAVKTIGILMNKPNTGEGATVRIYGEAPFVAGGTVNQGDELSNGSTTGHLVATTVGSGVTRYLLGTAKADVASGGNGLMTVTPMYRSAFS